VRVAAHLLPEVLFEVPTTERAVALSLDDGPDPATTGPVLDALDRHDARATFFLLGERAQRHRRLVEAIAARGHEVGNHTWIATRSASLPPDELERSVRRTQAVLAASAPVTLLRPGSGWVNGRVLEAARGNGLRCVVGSVYPQDPWLPSQRLVVRYVEQRARPGAIVALHEGPGRERVVEILDALLPRLRERGFAVTSISGLLSAAADPLAD
jgi:peptidoglycan-N-acetylglucosamine deacetylase